MNEQSTDTATGGLTMTRVFDASRDLVFQAWTVPAQFAQWFGGKDADVPASTVSMDVRAGGDWRATMFAGPERHEIHWHGSYREVVEPERVVFTISDQPGETSSPEVVTVVLTQLDGSRTEMRVHQGGGNLTPEQYEMTKQGYTAFFDAMEELLARR
jgi:uncharacterized protein YndB with AHSA1/START domain